MTTPENELVMDLLRAIGEKNRPLAIARCDMLRWHLASGGRLPPVRVPPRQRSVVELVVHAENARTEVCR